MTAVEFSRLVRLDAIGAAPRRVEIAADEGERAALAARFGLIAVTSLTADVGLSRDGATVMVEGRVTGEAKQACVATGDPVQALVDEPLSLRFSPEADPTDDVELGEADLDVLAYEGGAVDIGEAVAQSFALALDPFPRSPAADDALRAAGVLTEDEAAEARRETGPFAALKGLRRD